MLKIMTNQNVWNGFIEFSYQCKIKVIIVVYIKVIIIGI